MEYTLLIKVGIAIGWVVKLGYSFSAILIIKTGVKYVQDYKHYSEKEKVEVR